MRSLILGFVAGAALLQVQATLPPVALLWAALVASAVGIWRLWPGPSDLEGGKRHLRLLSLAACGVLAGFAWAGLFAQHYLARELPPEWEGRDLVVTGVVDSLPSRFAQGVRFNFAIEELDGAALPARFPNRVALSWYSGFRPGDLQPVAAVAPGERWRLNVRLRRPHGNANPHGFDYEVWLLEQNLRATGTVRPGRRLDTGNERLDAFVPGFSHAVERLRSALRARIYDALPEHDYAGVIVALVIGEQRAIAQSDWTVFNRTGISHLIAISGLHITMISALFAALVQALWRRSFFTRAQLPLLLPAQKAAAVAGAASALLYVLLAGFGIPAQRTLYMLSVVALALWTGRIASISHVLCLALFAVVAADPWAVLQPGFWLSFGAVATILYATGGRQEEPLTELSSPLRWIRNLKAAAHIQYAVTIALVPLTMLLFAQVSVIGPLANAIAIPLISFFVTPAALLGSVLPSVPGDWILLAGHAAVELLARLLHWMSALPGAVWSAPFPGWWSFSLAAVGVLWLLAPHGWPARCLGAVCLVPLLFPGLERPRNGEMWVTAFDVGQGTAVLIETPNRRLLYDTGPAYSPESDGGNRVILPYLKGRGIHALDMMVISHSDIDHAGGALSILEHVQVAHLSSSLAPDHAIVQRAPSHTRCEAGQSWTWDGVQFEMLYPAPAIYASNKWKPNARSCTLKVSLGERAVLLPGDIEAVQEGHLLALVPERLKSNVLLAPHHGSGTSSTQPFLEAVQPKVALFQVGRANRYRHPKPEVFERYGALGAQRLRTDETGAVHIRFHDRIELASYRQQRPRYWHGR